MSNLNKPEFDSQRDWIRKGKKNGKTWSELIYATKGSDEELEKFLKRQEDENFWNPIELDSWKELVRLEEQAEKESFEIEYLSGKAMIMDEGEDNEVTIPQDPNSSWQLYRKKLISNGFKDNVVDEIEGATIKLLKRLSNDTREIQPVKGLVIGNVQSGKTANMAALMAMAGDWGWNMFIVLSGTIENLRRQTQDRLMNDLSNTGNVHWLPLEHLSKKMISIGQRAQHLHLEAEARQRYFTVCLKNASRLKGLIDWLQSDQNKLKQMKILVIDDEADQAGVNTADVTEDTRRAINRSISDLVHGRSSKSKENVNKYRAMNYIGYTATPYANILNEVGDETLYPKNFISTLSVSKEYFGPQQIFGFDGGDTAFDGMDIVRVISESELEEIKEIHEGESSYLPTALRHSLCWFICGVSCMRYWGYKKPISMLIHTSQKTDHHNEIAEAIKTWINSKTADQLIIECSKAWKEETEQFSFEDFRSQYPSYDRAKEDINQYPSFEELKEGILEVIKKEVSNIPLDDEADLLYHEGIHMCIDNCKNNGVSDEGMHVRLAYPQSDKMPSPAPAFIIIGGATLSRGLTIEGLISSFFLRSVGQADSLMQMGRWFGYRKNYELLPRIWITKKTNEQFKFLAALDQDLRDEIHEMDTLGKSPSYYGPRIKNTPKLSFIRITAKNKMQSAIETDLDFSGSFNQTYLFDNDKQILQNNIEAISDLLSKIGHPERLKECNRLHAKNSKIWREVKFEPIREMLSKYKFQQRMSVFNDIQSLIKWIDKMHRNNEFEKWNIVLSNKVTSTEKWETPVGEVGKVQRTRKKSRNEIDSVINIGVLSDPSDIIADIDLDGKSDEIIAAVRGYKAKRARELRGIAGLDMTPQLVIYMIDKDSVIQKKSTLREDLNAIEDIVGICIHLPGRKYGATNATTISINLKNEQFNDYGDLEERDED